MKRKAIYVGSFDPVTLGHLNVIERAAKLYDELHVLVGHNPSKKYTFDFKTRVGFIQHATRNIPNVQVKQLGIQLLADYAYEADIPVIVKGVRDFKDFDYEKLLHEINLTQQRGVETVILPAAKEFSHVSSSAAKELCHFQGLINQYVTLPVKEALERSLNNQTIIGVTGNIGSGKSWVCKDLATVNTMAWAGMDIHNIELDNLAHEILFGEALKDTPAYAELREQVGKWFGLVQLDRKALGNIVFNDDKALKKLNEMMLPAMLTRLRQIILGKKGVILLNGALLTEFNLLDLCSNNIIVVTTTEEVRAERLRQRGLTQEQIERRLASQFSDAEKLVRIHDKIRKDAWGKVRVINNDGLLAYSPFVNRIRETLREYFVWTNYRS